MWLYLTKMFSVLSEVYVLCKFLSFTCEKISTQLCISVPFHLFITCSTDIVLYVCVSKWCFKSKCFSKQPALLNLLFCPRKSRFCERSKTQSRQSSVSQKQRIPLHFSTQWVHSHHNLTLLLWHRPMSHLCCIWPLRWWGVSSSVKTGLHLPASLPQVNRHLTLVVHSAGNYGSFFKLLSVGLLCSPCPTASRHQSGGSDWWFIDGDNTYIHKYTLQKFGGW